MEIGKLAAYATVASVVAAFILVLVTAWYAWQTKCMVNEMKEGRVKSVMPIVNCDVELDFKKTTDIYGKFNNIVVRNVGNSPAIDTIMELRLTNPDTSTFPIESQRWLLGIVGLNNQQTVVMKPCDLKMHSSAEPCIEITSSYSNAYGIEIKTISVFELHNSGPGPTDIKERVNWVKLQEKIEYPRKA